MVGLPKVLPSGNRHITDPNMQLQLIKRGEEQEGRRNLQTCGLYRAISGPARCERWPVVPSGDPLPLAGAHPSPLSSLFLPPLLPSLSPPHFVSQLGFVREEGRRPTPRRCRPTPAGHPLPSAAGPPSPLLSSPLSLPLIFLSLSPRVRAGWGDRSVHGVRDEGIGLCSVRARRVDGTNSLSPGRRLPSQYRHETSPSVIGQKNKPWGENNLTASEDPTA